MSNDKNFNKLLEELWLQPSKENIYKSVTSYYNFDELNYYFKRMYSKKRFKNIDETESEEFRNKVIELNDKIKSLSSEQWKEISSFFSFNDITTNKLKRFLRSDGGYLAPAINYEPIEKGCAWEYVKTVRKENYEIIVEYTNNGKDALRLPLKIMDDLVDFLNEWNEKKRLTHKK